MYKYFFKKLILFIILITFFTSSVIPLNSYAQIQAAASLPLLNVGEFVNLTPAFNPPVLKGIVVETEKPFSFDFILDKGDLGEDQSFIKGQLKKESERLIKYFLASLTIPENELWVNLSPYEKDRIIPDKFGVTEMGRDLLSQDYLLKQLTSSLMYPEDALGQEFWDKVYKKAKELYGTTDIPIDTFNKVWIIPDKAVVYENGNRAFVVEARLKVMLEQDYKAMQCNNKSCSDAPPKAGDRSPDFQSSIETSGKAMLEKDYLAQGEAKEGEDVKNFNNTASSSNVSTNIIRQVIIPALEQEVNTGKNFAKLRQIYNSLILATWYKNNLQKSILNRKYSDQKKTNGVEIEDKNEKQKIYEQYVESFKKGVYNYIKEDYDPQKQEIIPRKYFSGGVGLFKIKVEETTNSAMVTFDEKNLMEVKGGYSDPAMLTVPEIPSDAYNVLSFQGLDSSLEKFSRENSSEKEKILKGRDAFIGFLKRLGREIGARGPAVYYPFGGVDAFTSFNLVEGSEDVFSMGEQPFGEIKDILNMFGRENVEKIFEGLIKYKGYDVNDNLDYLKNDLSVGGFGLLRIPLLLDGKIKGLYYFKIDSDGNLRFLTEKEIQDTSVSKNNAVIEFFDPADKKNKRFWYLRSNIYVPLPSFQLFVNKLSFQTLLIKAPTPHILEGLSSRMNLVGDRYMPRDFFKFNQAIFLPARNNKAIVVCDQIKLGKKKSHSIWKKKYVPNKIIMNQGEQFGYSQPGGFVYFGRAENLIDFSMASEKIKSIFVNELLDLNLSRFSERYRKVVEEDINAFLKNDHGFKQEVLNEINSWGIKRIEKEFRKWLNSRSFNGIRHFELATLFPKGRPLTVKEFLLHPTSGFVDVDYVLKKVLRFARAEDLDRYEYEMAAAKQYNKQSYNNLHDKILSNIKAGYLLFSLLDYYSKPKNFIKVTANDIGEYSELAQYLQKIKKTRGKNPAIMNNVRNNMVSLASFLSEKDNSQEQNSWENLLSLVKEGDSEILSEKNDSAMTTFTTEQIKSAIRRKDEIGHTLEVLQKAVKLIRTELDIKFDNKTFWDIFKGLKKWKVDNENINMNIFDDYKSQDTQNLLKERFNELSVVLSEIKPIIDSLINWLQTDFSVFKERNGDIIGFDKKGNIVSGYQAEKATFYDLQDVFVKLSQNGYLMELRINKAKKADIINPDEFFYIEELLDGMILTINSYEEMLGYIEDPESLNIDKVVDNVEGYGMGKNIFDLFLGPYLKIFKENSNEPEVTGEEEYVDVKGFNFSKKKLNVIKKNWGDIVNSIRELSNAANEIRESLKMNISGKNLWDLLDELEAWQQEAENIVDNIQKIQEGRSAEEVNQMLKERVDLLFEILSEVNERSHAISFADFNYKDIFQSLNRQGRLKGVHANGDIIKQDLILGIMGNDLDQQLKTIFEDIYKVWFFVKKIHESSSINLSTFKNIMFQTFLFKRYAKERNIFKKIRNYEELLSYIMDPYSIDLQEEKISDENKEESALTINYFLKPFVIASIALEKEQATAFSSETTNSGDEGMVGTMPTLDVEGLSKKELIKVSKEILKRAINVIFIDLDDSLVKVSNDPNIPSLDVRTAKLIERLRNKNKKFIVVTARDFKAAMFNYADVLKNNAQGAMANQYLVTENGARIYKADENGNIDELKPIKTIPLFEGNVKESEEKSDEIKDILDKALEETRQLFPSELPYDVIKRVQDASGKTLIIKFFLPGEEHKEAMVKLAENVRKRLAANAVFDGIKVFQSSIAVNISRADKGDAVKFIAERLGAKEEETAVIGDSPLDFPMLDAFLKALKVYLGKTRDHGVPEDAVHLPFQSAGGGAVLRLINDRAPTYKELKEYYTNKLGWDFGDLNKRVYPRFHLSVVSYIYEHKLINENKKNLQKKWADALKEAIKSNYEFELYFMFNKNAGNNFINIEVKRERLMSAGVESGIMTSGDNAMMSLTRFFADKKYEWIHIGWREEIIQAVKNIDHPVIPKLKFKEGRYLTRWIKGMNLEQWAYSSKGLSNQEFIDQMIEWTLLIGQGSMLLNGEGIQHGDISLSNIVLDDVSSLPVLIDFSDEFDYDQTLLPKLIPTAIIARAVSNLTNKENLLIDGKQIFEYLERNFNPEFLNLFNKDYPTVGSFLLELLLYKKQNKPICILKDEEHNYKGSTQDSAMRAEDNAGLRMREGGLMDYHAPGLVEKVFKSGTLQRPNNDSQVKGQKMDAGSDLSEIIVDLNLPRKISYKDIHKVLTEQLDNKLRDFIQSQQFDEADNIRVRSESLRIFYSGENISSGVSIGLIKIVVNALEAIIDRKEQEPMLKGQIKLRVVREVNSLIVEIADNGIGIPENVVKKLFKEHITTKDSKKRIGGTGVSVESSYGAREIGVLGGVFEIDTFNAGTGKWRIVNDPKNGKNFEVEPGERKEIGTTVRITLPVFDHAMVSRIVAKIATASDKILEVKRSKNKNNDILVKTERGYFLLKSMMRKYNGAISRVVENRVGSQYLISPFLVLKDAETDPEPETAEFVKEFLDLDKDRAKPVMGIDDANSTLGIVARELKQDEYLTTKNEPRVKGGIDLNPNTIKFETKGDGTRFTWPDDPADLEKIEIHGLVPVIFSITPVIDLHTLLGLNNDAASEESMKGLTSIAPGYGVDKRS